MVHSISWFRSAKFYLCPVEPTRVYPIFPPLTHIYQVSNASSPAPAQLTPLSFHPQVHIPTNTSTTEIDEYASSHTVHTGQMFFTDAHMTLVSAVSPYTENPATRLALTADSIYNNDAAEVLNVTQVSADSIAAGLVANIEAIVDTTAVYTPASTASNVVATSSPSSTLAATPGSTGGFVC